MKKKSHFDFVYKLYDTVNDHYTWSIYWQFWGEKNGDHSKIISFFDFTSYRFMFEQNEHFCFILKTTQNISTKFQIKIIVI